MSIGLLMKKTIAGIFLTCHLAIAYAVDCSSTISTAISETAPCTLPSGGMTIEATGSLTQVNTNLAAITFNAGSSSGINNLGILVIPINGGSPKPSVIDITGGTLTNGIVNAGTLGILTAGANEGVRVQNATINGGITNLATGTVSVGEVALLLKTATLNGGVNNAGNIFGAWSFFAAGYGSTVNGGFVNSGSLTANIYGLDLYSGVTLNGGFDNRGVISTQFIPIYLEAGATINEGFTNSGTITNLATGNLSSTITLLAADPANSQNAAQINGGLLNTASGQIVSLKQNAISNAGIIDSITNRGVIFAPAGYSGINNTGTIGALSNLQGQGPSGALTYTGLLPTNYNVIVQRNGLYGQLSATNVTGATTWGIDPSSTFTPGFGVGSTYTSVLSGMASSNILNYNTKYYSNDYTASFSITPQSGIPTTWDLAVDSVVAGSVTIVAANTTVQASAITTPDVVLNGSTIQASSSTPVTTDLFLSSNGGTIDQNGLSGSFTSPIGDATSRAAGRLTIANSGAGGSVTLSGDNTYSGGTEVQSGATLKITSSKALGTGSLDLVGSTTVPATLATTATMTISNPITVAYDPVFSVAPTTTLTVSSPISDGVAPGAVVVSGGGALNLTAANTYTGPTIVESGSTLALGGSGSITPSSAVTNNGNFDVTNAASVVNLGGSFTQTGTGTTKLAASAGTLQKMVIAGTATLGGALNMTATTGNYRTGRYTLLSAGSLTGTYSAFSNNLASVTPLGVTLGYNANSVYLDLSPNAAMTLQGVQQNAQALSTVINMQAATLQAGLSYDCNKYDENNLCISVGGRYTYTGSGPSGNAQSGLVIVGYRPTMTTRVGAFADQSANISTPSNITQSKTSPMWGLFGHWNMNKDGNGVGLQASAAFDSSELNISRASSSGTEAGQGKTQFNGQAFQLQANYAHPLTDATKLVPYLGLRYTRINQGAYVENSSTEVLYPLSYNAMAQNTFSAIGGLGIQSHLAEKIKGTLSAGVQQNLNYSMGNYAGSSSVPGLNSFNVQMPGNTNTMATASAGLYYDVRKNERIGLTTLWQQQPFIHTNTTSVIATYTIGL